MRYKTMIDPNIDERIEIYANQRTSLINQIENLIENDALQIIGFLEGEKHLLNINEIYEIYTEGNKTYAATEKEIFQIKFRLYQIEEKEIETFIKINQSCLINKQYIASFKSSIAGSILVKLKNGKSEYISRRQVKNVMERMGIKKWKLI